MHLTAHGFVTGCLIYLCAGSLLWVLLDAWGIVDHTIKARLKRGEKSSMAALVIATAMMILAWPVFVFGFLAGMMTGLIARLRGVRR